jgi:hypothetical protein
VKHWGRLAGPQARKHQRLCGRRGSEEAQGQVTRGHRHETADLQKKDEP